MAHAIALPIRPGKTDAVRRFTSECLGPRKAEFDDMMRRGGYTEEAYWLQQDAERGDVVIAVSSRDHTDFDAIMANPQTDFDRWYRDQLREIFDMDPEAPSESRNEFLGTWQG
jgi:hypothetical protein